MLPELSTNYRLDKLDPIYDDMLIKHELTIEPIELSYS